MPGLQRITIETVNKYKFKMQEVIMNYSNIQDLYFIQKYGAL